MEENKIYTFLKQNNLTDKSESEFSSEYSQPEKAAELYKFFSANNLTDKDYDSFYNEYLKKKDESESLEEPTKSIVSTPEQEFLTTGETVTVGTPQPTKEEKFAENERKLFTQGITDEKEKKVASEALANTNAYFNGMGGMTPFQKMNELQLRVNSIKEKYKPEDIANLSQDELDRLDQEYTNEVKKVADELGLQLKEDGSVAPYENEVEQFKEKLADYLKTAEKDNKEEAGFFENLYLKLASGYESAAGNVLDLLGVGLGLNYFESYKSLSEGNRYNAEQLSAYANRYDNTIQGYLENGEIGKAAGAAVSGAVESLPAMLPVFINPSYGLGIMSGMSGIDKYRQIEDSDIPQWSKYYNAFITGASEYAGEKIVTLPILQRSKQAILSLGEKRGKQAIENALKKTMENNASKLGRMPEWVAEGLSEVATGISTDIVDKVTIDPNTQIGSHAIDDFAVGAVMGKIFALPQDIAKGMNKLAARDLAKNVVDKLPSDMDIDTKINLGWKIAERDRLQEAEDKLDEKFKGKYTARIVELNTEIEGIAKKYNEKQQPTTGTFEPVGDSQEKIDYLIEKGVEVPDGTTGEQLDALYAEEKAKEETVAKKEIVKTAQQVEEKSTIEAKPTVAEKAQVEKPRENIKTKQNGTEEVQGQVQEQQVSGDVVSEPEVKTTEGSTEKTEAGAKEEIIAYHGTTEDFAEFDESKMGQTDAGWFGKGFYFHTDKDRGGYGDIVKKVKIKLKNPLKLPVDYSGRYLYDKIGERAGLDKSWREESAMNIIKEIGSDKFTELAKELGYDGVIVEYAQGTKEIVAFGKESLEIQPPQPQIKPAETLSTEKGVNVPTEEKVAEKGVKTSQEATIDELVATKNRLESKMTLNPREKKLLSDINKKLKQNEKEEKKQEQGKRLLKEKRKQRFEEIDNELGAELENLADILGSIKKLSGEQRAKLLPTVARVTKLLAEKYALKGQELIDEVIAYFKNKNIDIDEQIIKESQNAKGNESSPLREQTKEEKGRGSSDSNLSGVNQTGVQDGKAAEEERIKANEKKYGNVEEAVTVEGGKKSRLGIRYAFGEGFSEEGKKKYRDEGLYNYTPESQEEVAQIAKSLVDLNNLEDVNRLFQNKQLPKRVRVAIGVLLADEYSNLAEKALSEGNTVLGDQMIENETNVINAIQKDLAIESGRDVAFFKSQFVSDRLTPYKTARQVEKAMNGEADKIRKSKGYKKTKQLVSDELHDLKKTVLKEVGKDKRVQQAKKRAVRKIETDPRKARIRKEIADLTDMLRAASKKLATSSIIGLNNDQIEIGGKIAAKYIELGIINVKELIQKLKKEFKKAGVDITDDEAKSMIPKVDGKEVDELEKEQVIEEAAARLAQEEFGYVADKKTPKTDPIAQMVRTLVAKFKERAKEGDRPAPRSNMDIIKEAILNKTDYIDVWKQALDSANELIDQMVADEKITEEQGEIYKQKVQDSYDKATSFSVSEKRVQQLIRESFNERDISIDDVVRDHYERRELHKQQLIDDLVKKSGLTDEAATELADVIDNAFQTLMTQKGEALLKKYFSQKNINRSGKKKTNLQKFAEYVRIDAFSSPEFLNSYFNDDVYNLINESLKALGYNTSDLLKSDESAKKKALSDIKKYISDNVEMSTKVGEMVYDFLDTSFAEFISQKGASEIAKRIKQKTKSESKGKAGVRSPIAEIIELVNIGAMESPEFDAIFGEMYGVPELSKEEKDEIIRRAKKIQKIKSADVRHKEEQKLMAYVLDLKPINPAEVLTAFWYAHVLSGVTTHIRNVSDAYVSKYLELLNLAGFNVSDIKRVLKANRRATRGEGLSRFKEVMTTGYTPLSKRLEIPSILERIEVKPKDNRILGKAVAFSLNKYKNFFKMIPRLLVGTDSWIYAGAKEMAADIIVSKQARQELRDIKGRKLTREEKQTLQSQIDKQLFIDKESIARFKAEIEQESEEYKQTQRDFNEEPTGYSQREKNLRLYEKIDQARGLDVTDKAFDIAGRAIGNIQTYGYMGWIIDTISRQLRKPRIEVPKPEIKMVNGKPVVTFNVARRTEIRPFSLVIPFTRIVANVATRNLGWNPIIATINATTGTYGKMLGKESPYYVEMTPEEKKVAWQKLVKIGIIHSLLFALTAPGDDDDPIIRITLNGTGDYEKNKQLMAQGWRPYSIQIGDVSFDYRLLGGFAMLLMPVGYFRDQQRFGGADEKSLLGLYAEANVMTLGHVLKTTPLYAINKMFEVFGDFMSGNKEMALKNFFGILGGMGTGFVSPRVVKDVEDLFNLISDPDAPRENPEKKLARAMQYIPFTDFSKGRKLYDVFGRPIPQEFTTKQIVQTIKEDDDAQYYIEQGYFRPAVSMKTTIFTLEDENGNTVRRKLDTGDKNETEIFNNYEQAVGQKFHEAVIDLRENGYKGEEFVEEMESAWRSIVKDAKADIYDYTWNNRVKYDKKALEVE